MALHPNFPESPYAIVDPAICWFPADEALRETSMDKLMPPLVPQLRKQVQEWRVRGYKKATDTSKSLLTHCLNADGDISNDTPRIFWSSCPTAVWLWSKPKAGRPGSRNSPKRLHKSVLMRSAVGISDLQAGEDVNSLSFKRSLSG